MKLSETDKLVLSVIDGRLPFSVLMIRKSLRYTAKAKRSIEQLKEVGVIYKDTDNMLRRTLDLIELNQGFDEIEPELAEALNSEPKIHYIPPAFDEEADNRRAEEWASITRKYSGQ